jgi:elongator complex protein 3
MKKTILEEFVLNLFSLEDYQLNEKNLAQLKNEYSKKYKISNLTNIELSKTYQDLLEQKKINSNLKIKNLISRRKIRSNSGVAVITNQTKFFPCPGNCVYCPNEPGMPKSYLSNQPASMRAKLNTFDAFSQTQNRLASLNLTGHNTDKIELIIIGGTWSSLPTDYQTNYIKDCFDALNQGIDFKNLEKTSCFYKCPKIKRTENSKDLKTAILKNETANNRCVGLTLETRPDYINEKEIKKMREYGSTRVELGVQTLSDEIQKLTKRGQYKKDIIKATQLLRDAGFKIAYHLMPGLPGTSPEKDEKMFEEVFKDPQFKPDLIKIYPCVVTKYSLLEKWYQEKKYQPLTEKELVPLLIKIKTKIPNYCRIIRLVRDIPKESIVAGVTSINLRQIIKKEMDKQNLACQCIRCREIKDQVIDIKKIVQKELIYDANFGKEHFLTYETNNKLISLLRLRIPSQYFNNEKHFIEELNNCALIREVHTYGKQAQIGNKSNSQHFGFGRKLIEKAENIAKEKYGIKKMAVISGVGVREYYRKFGYKLVGTYMIKDL